MSQNTVNYANNPTGPELLDNYLAKEQENTLSSNSGIQRPSYAISGTLWLDTSVTPWQYKIYDGSRDAVVGSLDNSSHTFTVSNINDSNLVHLSGTETITGSKTFSSGYKSNISVMYNDNITKGTAPSSNTQYINMYMVGDSRTSGDSNALGLFRTYVTTTNTVYSTMQAFKNVASSGASSALRTYYNTAQNKFGVELQALSTGTDTNESMSLSTNATDSARIPTMGWVNNPATSTNVVHRSGDETIDGKKNFTSSVNVSFPNITKGTNPSSAQYMGVAFPDKNGTANANRLGLVESKIDTNGTSSIYLQAYKYTSGTTTAAKVAVYYPASGNPYTEAPTPTDTTTTSGTQIATTGWVNSAGNNVVHRSGDETIAGTKTFSGEVVRQISGTQGIRVQHTGLVKGTAPSGSVANAGTQGQFVYQDKNGLGAANRLGGVTVDYNTNGSIVARLSAFKPESGSSSYASIQVIYPASGDAYTYAPTPAVSDSSTKIATTAYINTKFKKVSTLPASPDANTFYFIPE